MVYPVAKRNVRNGPFLQVVGKNIVGVALAHGRTIRRKSDPPPVGTPGRVQVVVRVSRQLPQAALRKVVQKQVAKPILRDGRKRKAIPFGTPGGRIQSHQPVETVGGQQRVRDQVVDMDHVRFAAFCDERKFPVRRNAHPAIEQVQRFEIVRPLAPNQYFRVSERTKQRIDFHLVHVGVARPVAHEIHLAGPVRETMERGLGAEPFGSHPARLDGRHLELVDVPEIPRADPGLPFSVYFLEIFQKRNFHNVAKIAVHPEILHEPQQFFLAPGFRHEATQRLALLVHQIGPADAVDIREGNEVIGIDGVPHDHFVGLVGRAGPVFRQPLRKPERKKALRGNAVVPNHAKHLGVGEHMHQFVPNHPPELMHVAVGGNNDPAFQKFEKSADSGGNEARRNVRLPEMQVRGIKNERRAVRKRKIEPVLQFFIGFLGKRGAVFGEFPHFRIVVNVEMLRFEDVPIEMLVLHLVAPEMGRILRPCRQGRGEAAQGQGYMSQSKAGHEARRRKEEGSRDLARPDSWIQAYGKNRGSVPDSAERTRKEGGKRAERTRLAKRFDRRRRIVRRSPTCLLRRNPGPAARPRPAKRPRRRPQPARPAPPALAPRPCGSREAPA